MFIRTLDVIMNVAENLVICILTFMQDTKNMLIEYIAIFIALYPIIQGIAVFLWHNYYIKHRLRIKTIEWMEQNEQRMIENIMDKIKEQEFKFK